MTVSPEYHASARVSWLTSNLIPKSLNEATYSLGASKGYEL